MVKVGGEEKNKNKKIITTKYRPEGILLNIRAIFYFCFNYN
jgi:hypothetical protein